MRVALLADAASVHSQRWAVALTAQGVEVAIWSEREWPNAPSTLPVHRLRPAGRNLLSAGRQLRRELDRFQPDVVHAHYVSRYGLYGALANRHPLVMSVWGADVEVFPYEHRGLNRTVLRWILRYADAITASSQYLQRVTSRDARQPVAVIPFGIDLAHFRPHPPNPGGPLRWIINKALEPVYGIDILLPVMKDLMGEGPWEGRILGDGSARQAISEQIAALGLSDRVSLVGRVTPEDLPEALAWADVGLYPSRRESFGVAPLEMQALGRAVMAHRLGGLPEVVKERETGYLVTPDSFSAWHALLADAVRNPDAIRSMGQQGPAFVKEHYDFHGNVEAMMALYDKAIGR